MNTAVVASLCPRCGAPIPPEAPGGLCPKCVLLRAATPSEGGGPSRRAEAPPLERVRTAFPQLEILELVGQGGMGFVYAARQPQLDRVVALKLLPVATGSDPTFAERFTREGRLLARLNHPNIVAVYDFGQTEGFGFLIMEFVDGVNLRQAMRSGRFSPREALAIVPRICEALQYAHEQGVLHRDIKPENILLDARGRVKLVDFGIAKLVGDQTTDFTLTASGARLGTPHYMAPEQIESPADVDHRADIYSLGVVFYELLTGELPLGRFAVPSAKADLDARVDEIVLRALAKERELRQQTAGEVKTQVETVTSEGGGGTVPPTGQAPSLAPLEPVEFRVALQHQPLVLLGLVALLVLLLADVLPLLAGMVPSLAMMARQNALGALLIVPLVAGAGWLIWLSWRFRERLLAPVGLGGGPGEIGRPLQVTATAVLLVSTVRLAFQGVLYGSALIGLALTTVRSNVVLSLLLLLVLAGLGLSIKDYLKRPRILAPPQAPPPWLKRNGILFLLAGAVAFVPTLLSWGSSFRVYHTGSLLALVGLAALTRSRLWRRIALAVCWAMVLVGVFGLSSLPVALTAGLPEGYSQGIPGTVAHVAWPFFLAVAQGMAFIAGLVLLYRRDVQAAFGLAVSPYPSVLPNPWPHRLFWLVVAPLALVASALIAAVLAPALQRSAGPVSGMAAGLIPVSVGGLVAWLFRRTRPTAAQARPQAQWNPWPRRLFWVIAGAILLPGFLLGVGLIIPQIMARRARMPSPPVVVDFTPPQPVFVQSVGRAAYGVEQEGQMAFVLFYPGTLGESTERTYDSEARTWTNRGSVTVPGEAPLAFERSSLTPDELRLGGTAYDLKAGRLFVLRSDGTVRQTEVVPPRPTPENLELFAALAGIPPSENPPPTPVLIPYGQARLERVGLTQGKNRLSARWNLTSDFPGTFWVRFQEQILKVELQLGAGSSKFAGQIVLSLDPLEHTDNDVLLTLWGLSGREQKRWEARIPGEIATVAKLVGERVQRDALLVPGERQWLVSVPGEPVPVNLEFRPEPLVVSGAVPAPPEVLALPETTPRPLRASATPLAQTSTPNEVSALWNLRADRPGRIVLSFQQQSFEIPLVLATEASRYDGQVMLSFERAADGDGVIFIARTLAQDPPERFVSRLAGDPETLLKLVTAHPIILDAHQVRALFGVIGPQITLEFRPQAPQP